MRIIGARGIIDVASIFAYSVSCALLHQLLQSHYYGQCRNSWLATLGLDASAYCVFVRKAISALEVSPLVATGLIVNGAFDGARRRLHHDQ